MKIMMRMMTTMKKLMLKIQLKANYSNALDIERTIESKVTTKKLPQISWMWLWKLISMQNVSSDSIVNEFYKIVAPNMASWLKSQYEKAKSTPYILELGNLEEQSFVKINDKIYIITNLALDTASCNCYEYQSLNIPCRHLFYARMNQNLSLFNLNMVHDRHKINLLMQPFEESNVNLVSTIPNLDSIRSFISSNCILKF
jgi:DNA-binding transcriptional regulator YdaS (Cro superfamily)